MNKLKKMFFVLIILVITLTMFTNIVKAANEKDEKINDIKIDVIIDKNGTASITEVWDFEIYDTVEMYKAYFNLKTSKINNLTVKDEKNNKLELVDDWDIDVNADDQKKIGKCGIYVNEKNGETDICWGIKEDGKHIYTLSYDITNFIEQKMGYQNLNFKFLSSGITPTPKKASITIQTEGKFNEKNLNIEGIGYEGESKIENNKIIFSAPNGLKKQDYMEVNIDFNDNSVLNQSEEISQDVYKQGGILEQKESNKYKVLSTMIVIIMLMVGIPIYYMKVKKDIDKKNKK